MVEQPSTHHGLSLMGLEWVGSVLSPFNKHCCILWVWSLLVSLLSYFQMYYLTYVQKMELPITPSRHRVVTKVQSPRCPPAFLWASENKYCPPIIPFHVWEPQASGIRSVRVAHGAVLQWRMISLLFSAAASLCKGNSRAGVQLNWITQTSQGVRFSYSWFKSQQCTVPLGVSGRTSTQGPSHCAHCPAYYCTDIIIYLLVVVVFIIYFSNALECG